MNGIDGIIFSALLLGGVVGIVSSIVWFVMALNVFVQLIRPRVMVSDIVRFTEFSLIVNSQEYTRFLFPKMQSQVYTFSAINNIRYGRPAGIDRGRSLLFDYHGTTYAIGEHFPEDQTRWLINTLHTIQTFRCHEVLQVVFGAVLPPHIPSGVSLLNPDVSELHLPFWRLTRIIIMAEYDFHLVERFLTYAVNTLGQAYLKDMVTVEIIGEPALVHPNLRNSLTNLCRQVMIRPPS